MPSREILRKLSQAHTLGQQRKVNSDYVMEATWDGDIASRTGYLFDMAHDPNPRILNNMDVDNPDFVPIKIKYIKHTSQTMAKDAVTYHLQLLPGQECNVPYYEWYERTYDMEFPIGLYIAIPDDKGIYNRWLIVTKAEGNSAQFVTYEILRCDFVLQFIMDSKKWNIAGVTRSQNSYNSGVWVDKVVVPYGGNIIRKLLELLGNPESHLCYNMRMKYACM